jgi:hypothetical protein
MEGIVRKTWKQFPECDICFVYTFNTASSPDLKTNYFNRSVASMEVVADHYGIPTIHMGLEAVRLENEGKLALKAPEVKMHRVSGDELNKSSPMAVGADGKIPFSADGTHPFIDTGHRLYMEAIERSIPKITEVSTSVKPHDLPAPYDPQNYGNTVMLPMEKAKMSEGWTKLPQTEGLGKQFISKADSLWRAEPGATLSFKFRGSIAKIYDLLGPDCGSVEISVDGEIKNPGAKLVDGYCTYNRLATLSVATGLDEKKVHEIMIKVLPTPLDKEKILFEQNRTDFKKNPDKYKDLFWYACALFLVGELVE